MLPKDEGFVCSCDKCKSMCKRPCWGTPEEVERLLDAGFASLLMEDYWVDCEEGDIHLLCPACPGYGGRSAPFMPTTGCVFHDSDGLCKVHVSGLKPLEGKVASCRGSPPGIHFQVAKSWDSVKGREILARWRSEVKG